MIDVTLKLFPAKYKNQTIELIKKYELNYFYYFTLVENISAIVRDGIISFNEVAQKKAISSSFANMDVQDRRARKVICIDKTLDVELTVHDFVPTYLTPFTPTLYEVCKRPDISRKKLAFIFISTKILFDDNMLYLSADGNAAAEETKFYLYLDGLREIDWGVIRSRYWTRGIDGKRKRNAELLFFPSVRPKYFEKIVFLDRASHMSFRSSCPHLLKQGNVEVDTGFLNDWLPD